MSGYYEFDVDIEGIGRVGVYADDEDEAHDTAFECDISDIEVRDLNVTSAKIVKTEKAAP